MEDLEALQTRSNPSGVHVKYKHTLIHTHIHINLYTYAHTQTLFLGSLGSIALNLNKKQLKKNIIQIHIVRYQKMLFFTEGRDQNGLEYSG